MRFYATTDIGPTRSMTHSGYMLCRDVALARTGTMEYGPSELAEIPHDNGRLIVTRDDEDLFADIAVSSFEGMPVTMGHPAGFVGPENWSRLSKGTIHNVRRGIGDQADILLGDLLITDADSIAQINAGLREVSLGYDADYEVIEPGRARQRNILGNHVALVARGRCGPRCAIGDEETPIMASGFKSRLMRLLKAKDEAEVEKVLEEEETRDEAKEDEDDDKKEKAKTEDGLNLASVLARMDERMGAIEARLTPPPVAAPTTDAAPALPAAWQKAVAQAEILAPSSKIPTFDAAPVKTFDALCECQRAALKVAYATPPGKMAIDTALGGAAPTFDAMTSDALQMLFGAAAGIMRSANNGGFGQILSAGQTPPANHDHRSVKSIQARAEALWAGQAMSNVKRA